MNTEKEEYRVYFERYEVSNYGNVRRKLKNGYRYLQGNTNKGYSFIAICPLDTTQKPYKVPIHRMVGICFLDKPLCATHNQIDHIDRNKKNNHISNLRWVSNRINVRNTRDYHDNIYERQLQDGTKRFFATVMVKGIFYHKTFNTRDEASKWLNDENYEDVKRKRSQGKGSIKKKVSKKTGAVKYRAKLQSKNKYGSKTFDTFEEAEDFLASL